MADIWGRIRTKRGSEAAGQRAGCVVASKSSPAAAHSACSLRRRRRYVTVMDGPKDYRPVFKEAGLIPSLPKFLGGPLSPEGEDSML